MNRSANAMTTKFSNNPESRCFNHSLNGPTDIVRRTIGTNLPKSLPKGLDGDVHQFLGNRTATSTRNRHCYVSDESLPTHTNIQLHKVAELKSPRSTNPVDDLLIHRDTGIRRETTISEERT